MIIAAIVALLIALGCGYALAWRRAERHYRQVAALLLGLRDGDYALRAAPARRALGAAYASFNALADGLMGTRRAGIESDALLGKLLGAVDLAIIVVGPGGTIRGANGAAGDILGLDAEILPGRTVDSVGIGDWADAANPHRLEAKLPGGSGPWDVRRVRFRRAGRDHLMLVANDLSRTLRDEERRVWRGLIRVLSHETGNSLAPIQATAEALQRRGHDPTLSDGLALIERRARSLARFIRRYADLARLPPPAPEPVALAPLLQRIAALEQRVPVSISIEGDAITRLDPVQIEQALINLVTNAADAALETVGSVTIRCCFDPASICIIIDDDGHGLPQTENLFVPGFTTKQGGSGIGLVLAREIIEAHGGSIQLTNRADQRGARAIVNIPINLSKVSI
jgi:PAS domain S-box-containing protein